MAMPDAPTSAFSENTLEPSNPTGPSVYANARRTRKHPLVARRIAELQAKLMPGPEDLAALYRHALAVGLQLSVEAEVPKPPAPQVRYIEKLGSKPGHFPPQFERVPVRKSEGSGEW